MRRARVNDYWRAMERGQSWRIQLIKLAFSDVSGVGSGELHFSSPVTFLCGPNGAGKTTLLRAIGAVLSPSDARTSPSTRFRLNSGTATIEVRSEKETHIIDRDLSTLADGTDWDATVEIFHVDTSSVVSDLQNYFCEFPSIQDALNGVPILEASPKNLQMLSYLTNIPYLAARVYTLEETTLGLDRNERIIDRPFFEVQTARAAYDIRTMGLGEVAAFYLWWSLESVTDRTILLLEEPESFLSPLCQAAFADVLAQYAATKKALVVVTTHSPQIIQSAPKTSLRFIYKDGQNSRVDEGSALEALLRTVGIESRVRTIILVEDNAARIFAKLWISNFSPGSASAVELIAMGGDGNVLRALNAFPSNPSSFALIGLLDGDAEAKGFAGERVAFLPGGKPLETLYREMVERELDRVEPILGINNLRQILYPLQGVELHEWFEQLRSNSSLSHDQLHLMLFRAWMQNEDNKRTAERYYSQLREKIED